MALFHHLREKKIPGIADIIPAYTSVTVVYDILATQNQSAHNAFQFILQQIKSAITTCNWQYENENTIIKIPVCYDIVFGIDLEKIALEKRLSTVDIIKIHTATVYDVYMLGFLPGFPYMGMVDNVIATKRLETARTNVAAGSVGIAGNQTGIYPVNSPGGWNIIGRTPVQIFDIDKEEPCLLQPGNRIQFVPVNMEEYMQLKDAITTKR